MKRYIDKDIIVAEIERRKSELQSKIAELGTFESNTLGLFQEVDLYDDILSFLDTFEVKEVDLEKEYDNEFFKDPVFGKLVNRNAGISIAKHFFELGLTIQKGE